MRSRRVCILVSIGVLAAVTAGAPTAGTAAATTRPGRSAASGDKNGKDPSLDQTKSSKAKRTAAYTRTARLAITDIQSYWAATFPDVYGARYQAIPANRIFA